MATLNGRIEKLEAAATATLSPDHCRTCGLRHVYPTTLAIIRAVLGVEGGGPSSEDAAPRLCLCACCADGRYLARLSHGLPPDRDAA